MSHNIKADQKFP